MRCRTKQEGVPTISRTRAAIYARYSSDRQSERSAEDQARLCRQRIEQEGWVLVDVFADLALSGATRIRPGLMEMLTRAADFDIIVAESLDRLSRDQEDIAGIYKRLRFAGVRIVTLSEGEVSELHIGLKGTMAALFLKDLGEKTRRGQIGRVANGRIPGGLSYGYRRVAKLDADGEPERGLRQIDAAEAEVVRRIFREFLAGRSPRAIAQTLNKEGVPSPSGKEWRSNTIYGSRERGNGILHNALYVGVINYNRQSFVRDPATGKRVARSNPRDQWVTTSVPDLAVIDRHTWTAASERLLTTSGVRPERQRRPKRLLSGLLRCGVCGGTYTIIGRDHWGCSTHRELGTCPNNRGITNKVLEQRVLAALRDRMLQPEAVAAYIEAYQLCLALNHQRRQKQRKALAERALNAERRITRLTLAIADGGKRFADIRNMLTTIVAERERCRRELADVDLEPTQVLTPDLAERYRTSIENLSVERCGDLVKVQEVREALRDLIGGVIATPAAAGRGVGLEVRGQSPAGIDCTNGNNVSSRS